MTITHSGFYINTPSGSLQSDLLSAAQVEHEGDRRYPRDLEKYSEAELSSLGIFPLITIGSSKLIDTIEFQTPRRNRICTNKLYFNLEPPMRQIDLEDPHNDMIRYVHPIPREVVKKGSKFLFGRGRFTGVEAFIFEKGGAAWEKQWRDFWVQNDMDTKMVQNSEVCLWAGDAFFKFGSETLIEKTLSVPEEAIKDGAILSDMKEKRTTTAFAIHADSENFYAITEKDRPDIILAWVHQYQRYDGSFYREEIFKDLTLVYEGRLKQVEKASVQEPKYKIEGSGISYENVTNTPPQSKIEFILVKIIDYPEFDELPVVCFRNEPDNDMYGISVYHGLHGKFDMLNAVFTRSLFALENQATPLMWIAGATESTGNNVHTSDAIWYLADKDASVNVTSWDGTPKAVFEFIDRIERQIFKLVGVPKSSELDSLTNVSGSAILFANTDIIDTTNQRRLYYELGLRKLVRLVRKAYGYKIPIEDSMTIKWGPIFPESPNEKQSSLMEMKRENIIPYRYVVKESPFIPFHEKEELMKEADLREEQDIEFRRQALEAQSKRTAQRTGGNASERGTNKTPKAPVSEE